MFAVQSLKTKTQKKVLPLGMGLCSIDGDNFSVLQRPQVHLLSSAGRINKPVITTQIHSLYNCTLQSILWILSILYYNVVCLCDTVETLVEIIHYNPCSLPLVRAPIAAAWVIHRRKQFPGLSGRVTNIDDVADTRQPFK
jgi:hypothetical protein